MKKTLQSNPWPQRNWQCVRPQCTFLCLSIVMEKIDYICHKLFWKQSRFPHHQFSFSCCLLLLFSAFIFFLFIHLTQSLFFVGFHALYCISSSLSSTLFLNISNTSFSLSTLSPSSLNPLDFFLFLFVSYSLFVIISPFSSEKSPTHILG